MSQSRMFEGLKLRFDLDDMSKSSLLSASTYQSEGYHKYFRPSFLDHVLQTIIVSTFFPYYTNPAIQSHATSMPNFCYERSVLYLIENQYKFQRDNVLNIAEDMITTLVCMLTRCFPDDHVVQEYDDEILAFCYRSLAEYHAKLFDNYVKWGVHLGNKHMFPWTEDNVPYRWHQWQKELSEDQIIQSEAVMLQCEIMLYRCIWGEASVVRHLPECLNFLFRWAIEGWRDNLEGITVPEFIDCIGVIAQRCRDEQWNGIKRKIFIDHIERLHYDDLNELFWDKECMKWLEGLKKKVKKGHITSIRFSVEHVTDLLSHVTRSDKPNTGKKTFAEVRSYLFVFLSIYRVLYLHALWFPITWTIYSYLNGADTTTYEALITILPTSLRFVKAVIEVTVGIWSGAFHKRAKKSWGMWKVVKVICSFLLCAYVWLFSYVFGSQSDCFRFLKMHGVFVAWPILIIYIAKESQYYLYCKLTSGPRSSSLASRGGKLGSLVRFISIGTNDLVAGRKSQLAQSVLDVAGYSLIWIFIWSLKTAYWVFGVCPIINESITYLDMVELRPVYITNIAAVTGLGSWIFWAGVWVPTAAVYLYDSQVFFLLSLSVIATIGGFMRRVGYMKDYDRVRKQLLPFLPTLPFVAATNPIVETQPTQETTHNSVVRHLSQVGASSIAARTLGTGRTDQVNNAIWLGMQDCDDMVMKRQRLFAFFWNNIVKDWRSEDILSNEQMHSLFFSEVPALPSRAQLGEVPRGAWWKNSNIRLPLHVLWDVLGKFVQEANAYTAAVEREQNNKAERMHLHKRFFTEHLSPKDLMNSTSTVSLHFIVGMELEEVLRDVLDNSFGDSDNIITGYTMLVSWIVMDWRHLEHIHFGKLGALISSLITVLKIAVELSDRPFIRAAEVAKTGLAVALKNVIRIKASGNDWDNDDSHPIGLFLESVRIMTESTIIAPDGTVPLPEISPSEKTNVLERMREAAMDDMVNHLPKPLLDALTGKRATQEDTPDMFALSTIAFGGIDLQKVITESRQALKTVEVLQAGSQCIRSIHFARLCLYKRGITLLQGDQVEPLAKEATRRMITFLNTLVMKLPGTPFTTHMKTLSTLTPYYREDVETSLHDMYMETDEGISKMDLLRSLFTEEFDHFLERCDTPGRDLWNLHQRLEDILRGHHDLQNINKMALLAKELIATDQVALLAAFRRSLSHWVTYRGQTLLRTIRGQMHIEEAIHMQSHLDSIGGKCHGAIPGPTLLPHFIKRYQPILGNWATEICVKSIYQFNEAAELRARLNFTYILAAQEFGNDFAFLKRMRAEGKPDHVLRRDASANRAMMLISAMKAYPSLAVATLESQIDPVTEKSTGRKVSALYRWQNTTKGKQTRPPLTNKKTNLTLFKTSELDDQLPLLSQAGSNRGMFVTASRLDPPTIDNHRRHLFINSPNSKPNQILTRSIVTESPVSSLASPSRRMECAMSPVTSHIAIPQGTSIHDLDIDVDSDDGQEDMYSVVDDLRSITSSTGISTVIEANTDCSDHIVVHEPQFVDDHSHMQPPPSSIMTMTIDRDEGSIRKLYSVLHPMVHDEDGQLWARYPIIGPGKPENQNHACIYARGELLQAIDMNMDFHLEEAIKVRNLLQEFSHHPDMAILGFREHVFTMGVSSISNYMALQETTFVTNSQRAYAHPLRVRMHYGHPDIFDRYFAMTCGGMSKSSNGLHLSEDIFAGFNATLRGRAVRHVDYVQAGKGRDVGLHQISMFEKKVSAGNGEQMISRDVYRMLSGSDIGRALSIFYTSVGFYINVVLLFFLIFFMLYLKLTLTYAQSTIKTPIKTFYKLVIRSTTTVELQLGMFLIVPIMLQIALDEGIRKAARTTINMLIKFATLYYTFMLQTKANTVDNILIHGGASYQETGRGLAVSHQGFVETWKAFFTSHLLPGFEMLIILSHYVVHQMITQYDSFGEGLLVMFLDTWIFWVVIISLLWTPTLFNPSGLNYGKLREDLRVWIHWMRAEDGWERWWFQGLESRDQIHWYNRVFIIIRLMRFLFLAFAFSSILAFRLKMSDVDLFLYLVVSLALITMIKSFANHMKLLSPMLHNITIGVLFCAIGSLIVMAYLTELLDAYNVYCLVWFFGSMIYSLCEMSIAFWGAEEVKSSDLVKGTLKFIHFVIGCVVMAVPIAVAVFTTNFDRVQNRMLFNSKFVDMINVGRSSRAAQRHKGQDK